jgi:glycosyltransferase involved in cell wall biosynthesis
MACGTPVIATRAPGTSDIVEDEENGILVEDSSSSICSAIVELLSNREMRRRLGEAGRKKVLSEFELTRTARRMVEVYERFYGSGSPDGGRD